MDIIGVLFVANCDIGIGGLYPELFGGHRYLGWFSAFFLAAAMVGCSEEERIPRSRISHLFVFMLK